MDRVEETPPRAGWSLRDMLRAGLAALALVAVGIGVLAVVGIIATLAGLGDSLSVIRLLAVFALEAVLILPAWLWGPRKYGGGWASLGLRPFAVGKAFLLLLVSVVFIVLINQGWELIRQRLGWAGQPDYLPLFGNGPGGLLLALFLGGIIAPVAEEIFFRGFIYGGLRARLGLTGGVLASALIFAVVHLVPGVLPPIFIMGALFALLYEWTGSIWPGIVLHGVVNALAFISAYLLQNMPQMPSG